LLPKKGTGYFLMRAISPEFLGSDFCLSGAKPFLKTGGLDESHLVIASSEATCHFYPPKNDTYARDFT